MVFAKDGMESSPEGELGKGVSELDGQPRKQPVGVVRKVLVVGGGTSGYFAALAIRRQFPDIQVTLVESSKVPIIGVGEATTTLMPPFLHKQLGFDIVEFYREVRPTWKLGIKFDWGAPGEPPFMYPFGATKPIEAFAHEGQIANQSVGALLMAADRTPILDDENGALVSLLRQMKFAYHLDNRTFVSFLAKRARAAGVHHIDAEIERVAVTPDAENVDCLVLDDGRRLRADLYVDASGFRSLLMGEALRSPFVDFASSLFCDSALVGNVPQHGAIEPYTTAQTMDFGWCWRIPVEGEDHRGYVYSSAHVTVAQARAEMAGKNPGLGDTWSVRFRSGRHADFWKGNTVALGNAYGFVEPLESTALHMVIVSIAYLLGGLEASVDGPLDRAFANRCVAAHWDFLRWFLAIHYKFNRRSNTDFWRDCRERVDVSGLAPVIDRYRASGPWYADAGNRHYVVGDAGFSFEGIMILLLGQRVPCPRPDMTSITQAEWNQRVAECSALTGRAFGQAAALQILRNRPEILEEFVTSKESWINRGAELLSGIDSAAGILHPRSDSWSKEQLPFNHLF